MTPEQEQAIAELRAQNVAPKQIARRLGLRPAEVTAVIKAQAEQITADRAAAGELYPIYQILVNKSCLPALLSESKTIESETIDIEVETAIAPTSEMDEDSDEVDKDFDDTDEDFDEADEDFDDIEDSEPGFAVVVVARQAGFNRLEVCTYLVDIWCLGVKDASGPRRMDPILYKDFVDYNYRPFPTGTEEISLELAQAIVFGAVDYAAKLGFQPHRDFEPARSHLGQWSGQPTLTFGRNGKPYYFSGPYDDPNKILKTLRQSVGEGNFHYVVGSGGEW
ncbi:MAG: DNA-binding response regulator [Leptolyngbyaceae cyanobacterium RU_5_1]|nr:DNA-binding response regulator [Leptolyngbyaceae cyanobacterium RU_5_1]